MAKLSPMNQVPQQDVPKEVPKNVPKAKVLEYLRLIAHLVRVRE